MQHTTVRIELIDTPISERQNQSFMHAKIIKYLARYFPKMI